MMKMKTVRAMMMKMVRTRVRVMTMMTRRVMRKTRLMMTMGMTNLETKDLRTTQKRRVKEVKGHDKDNEMSPRTKKIGGDETIAEENIVNSPPLMTISSVNSITDMTF